MKVTRGIIIIVLFLTPILLSYNTVPAVVSRGNTTLSSSQNWLDGWQVRKLHTIEGSLGAGTDYQIRIIVHYGSGIDTDENIFCTSFCNDDFSDIRFTDDDGITELDYWMEQSYVSDNATFWVEVRDNLDTSQIIFVYYNNTAAVSSSNGTNTFLLFDDFEGVADSEPSTDLWYVKSGLNGIRLDGNSHLILDDEVDADDRGSIYTREVYGSCNLSILSKTWCSSGTVRNMNWGAFSNYTVSDVVTYSANSWTDGLRFSTVNNGILTSTDGYVDNMNAWHLYDLKWFPGDAYLFQDDNEKFHHTTNIPDSLCNVSLGEGTSGGGAYALVDWVVLRNCIASEPSHGEWGTLEYAPPLIDTPSNLTYEAGTTNNFVTWSPISVFPEHYEVYLDNSLYENETWDGSVISISVDGLDPGTYNLTLQVSDTNDNYMTDSVNVFVEDTTNPIITHPPDVTYNETSTGNTIQWNLTDLYPASYVILLDNELQLSGPWNASGESIQISIDGLSAGTYTYNLTLIDQSGNLAFDLVSVVVLPLSLIGEDYMVVMLMIGGVAVVVIIGAAVCKSKKP